MDFYETVDLAKPSQVLQEQMVLEILDEVTNKFKEQGFNDILQHCYMLNGERVKSLIGVH